jgi:GAF domain-containing protein
MPETPLPPNEAQRLEALYSYQVLDSVQENEFDELVELAAQITGCPVASISFIDKDRQWFKASKNLPVQETHRKDAFCSYTILENEQMVVEDARRDPRFKNYPDVTGGLGIVFYAGIPIHTQSGFNLGTVCVIDHKPGKLSEPHLAALKIIAKQVSTLLE